MTFIVIYSRNSVQEGLQAKVLGFYKTRGAAERRVEIEAMTQLAYLRNFYIRNEESWRHHNPDWQKQIDAIWSDPICYAEIKATYKLTRRVKQFNVLWDASSPYRIHLSVSDDDCKYNDDHMWRYQEMDIEMSA